MTDRRSVPEWIGRTFGAWTVIDPAPSSKARHSRWNCKCECGVTRTVLAASLLRGRSTSCGCKVLRAEASPRFKHGKKGGIYAIWLNIIQRCENPSHPQFHDYGGRGIKICERWRNDYAAFASDMGERPSEDHQIDRRDNSRGYDPENCGWATRSENMLNTRRNHLLTYQGEVMPLAEACRRAGVNYGTAKWRLKHGWSDAEALS